MHSPHTCNTDHRPGPCQLFSQAVIVLLDPAKLQLVHGRFVSGGGHDAGYEKMTKDSVVGVLLFDDSCTSAGNGEKG